MTNTQYVNMSVTHYATTCSDTSIEIHSRIWS